MKNVGAGPWGPNGTQGELDAYLLRVNEELAVRGDRLRKLEAACLELESRLGAPASRTDSPGRFVAAAHGKRKQERAALSQLETERNEVRKEFERATERKELVESELKKLR